MQLPTEFKYFHYLLAFLSGVLLFTGSHGSVPSENYWKSLLPSTPLPPNILMAKTLKDVLQNPSTEWMEHVGLDQAFYNWVYEGVDTGRPRFQPNAGVGKGVVIFFLEKDLYPGKRMRLKYQKSTKGAKFLPRLIADSIPFSSTKLPEILSKFSVDPSSDAGEAFKETIRDCERVAMKGEEKFCATSLESMVGFSSSKLGKDVEAIWTKENKKGTDQVKEYSIVGVKRRPNARGMIACHKMPYPYGVFYCHKISKTVAYEVSLVATDGSKLEAVASCHQDTAAWSPTHLAFQLLNENPGGLPVCHFLPKGHIMWVGNRT